MELINGKKVNRIVIEIQHSKQSKNKYLEHTRKYNQKNIHVLWILNGGGPYDRSPRNIDGIIISQSEKELHSLYRGRVYYINITDE